MRRNFIGAAALAALTAGMIPLSTPAPTGPSQSPASVSQRTGEKQAPAQAPTTAPAGLEFLAELGSPFRRRGEPRRSGCPWPGRKIACMMRTAGRVKRMRH